jgi:hypothetical protein
MLIFYYSFDLWPRRPAAAVDYDRDRARSGAAGVSRAGDVRGTGTWHCNWLEIF